MQQARLYPPATRLPNGQVLVAGGYRRGLIVGAAELYNPASGTFATTGSLKTARYSHTPTLLNNGKVLIAGGQNPGGPGQRRQGFTFRQRRMRGFLL